MPKITQKVVVKGPKQLPERPPEWADRYSYVGYPAKLDEVQKEVTLLTNQQSCTCGHDRTCHSDFLGRGERQVLVVDCPYVGRCNVIGCECDGFVFGEDSSKEGHDRRRREIRLSPTVFPPKEDEV